MIHPTFERGDRYKFAYYGHGFDAFVYVYEFIFGVLDLFGISLSNKLNGFET